MGQKQAFKPTPTPREANAVKLNLRMTVHVALFTALIIIGGYISVPLPVGPVPIVLADFFVMLSGLFLGLKWGLTSVALYLSLGALGLPVFASGTSGLAILLGPTGGFLLGYMLMVTAVGFITGKRKPSLIRVSLALIVGNILLYSVGVPWLKGVLHLGWGAAFTAGLIPFIPGTIIKIIVATTLARVLLPRFQHGSVATFGQ
ncbi:MAG TPA: biotin transporter BioY [Hydrogenispora sp.]|jgi:biotin transport system substrate-specific component|nr:biotin transporter BioY [Hydrogenispora sp.]